MSGFIFYYSQPILSVICTLGHGEDHIINSIFIMDTIKINFYFACLLLCLLFGEQGTKQGQWAREEDGKGGILSSISKESA